MSGCGFGLMCVVIGDHRFDLVQRQFVFVGDLLRRLARLSAFKHCTRRHTIRPDGRFAVQLLEVHFHVGAVTPRNSRPSMQFYSV